MKHLPRSHWRFAHFAAAAFALLLAAAPSLASAASLDKNACAKIAQDIQNLKALEVDKLMEKGPNWAVEHLSPGDLGLVRQYIGLDEQMKFRCSAPGALVHLKHLDDEDEDNAAKPLPEAGPDTEQGASQGEKSAMPQGQPKAPAKRKSSLQQRGDSIR